MSQALDSIYSVIGLLLLTATLSLIPLASTSVAQEHEVFQPGPAIPEFGKIATVQSDMKIPADTILKVRFDVARQARKDQINTTLDSAARLINLHAAAGIKPENLQIAIVLHGNALMDVTSKTFYGLRHDGRDQASLKAVRILHQHKVKFYVCGQSAAHHKVTKGDLLPVIKVAPSAMTAHAILAAQGYSLNPF